ncbi:MAG: nucleoside-diphosphate kinase [Actinobacteria bacterium]|nr:MAG: nucleoside-diphosphate kinase [Actinomycetota bacterium]
MEQTFIMIKPNAVEKGLVGEILKRIESKGLKVVEQRMSTLSKEKASELYAVHKERPFYNDLVEYITSGPVVLMKVEGNSAVKAMRSIMGATDPLEAASGTIRGDYGLDITKNLVHGSDSAENAQKELNLFF